MPEQISSMGLNTNENILFFFFSIFSVLCFVFFGWKACEILTPQPGVECTPPALEMESPN